jgi:tetratricopeptide (TPR) repeat protein
VAGAGAVLAGVTVGAVLAWRRAPYVLAGWAWYLAMLVPVIGLVQVGMQARADRYTYLPLLGVTVGVVWGLAGLGRRLGVPGSIRALAATVVLVILATGTSAYLAVWREDETLFRHALAVTRDNYVAHDNLAMALLVKERGREALEHAAAAARIAPEADPARHVALGRAFARIGMPLAAAAEYRRALEIEPGHPTAARELALLMAGGGGGPVRPGR